MSIDTSSGRAPDALPFITAFQRPGNPRVAAAQSEEAGNPTHRLLLEEAR